MNDHTSTDTPPGTPSVTPQATPRDMASDTPADRLLAMCDEIESEIARGRAVTVYLSALTPLGEQPIGRIAGADFDTSRLKPGKYSARPRLQGGTWGTKVTFTVQESPFQGDAPGRHAAPSSSSSPDAALVGLLQRIEARLSALAAPAPSPGLTIRDAMELVDKMTSRGNSDPLQVLTLAEKLATKFAPPVEDPNTKVISGTMSAIGEMVKLGRIEQQQMQQARPPAPTTPTTQPDAPPVVDALPKIDLGNADWNAQAKELQEALYSMRGMKAGQAAFYVSALVDRWEQVCAEPPILTWYGIARGDPEELAKLASSSVPASISPVWVRGVVDGLKAISLERMPNETNEETR